jgi:hypothetical protein
MSAMFEVWSAKKNGNFVEDLLYTIATKLQFICLRGKTFIKLFIVLKIGIKIFIFKIFLPRPTKSNGRPLRQMNCNKNDSTSYGKIK